MTDHKKTEEESPRLQREQLADWMLTQREVLVSRIRRQLGQRGLAPALADDIFSTTIRRTDALLAAGRLVGEISDTRLIALATAVARNAVRENCRAARRQRLQQDTATEHARSRGAMPSSPQGSAVGFKAEVEAEVEAALARIDERALALLGLRLRGAEWPAIAEELGMSTVAAQRLYYRALKSLAAPSA